MHVRTRGALVLSALLIASAAPGALPAHAAVPSNDTRGGATAVTSLPLDLTQDTTGATLDADDGALDVECEAPATGSVWFTYTPPAGVTGLALDARGSSYSAGLLVAQDDGNGGLEPRICGTLDFDLEVTPGTTYTILAFDADGAGGGTLVLHAEQVATTAVDVTVTATGTVDKAGRALVSGTYTCTDGDFVELSIELSQSVGRFGILGSGSVSDSGTCDGTTRAWSALVRPSTGRFGGGKATSTTVGLSCGTFSCAEPVVQQRIALRRSAK